MGLRTTVAVSTQPIRGCGPRLAGFPALFRVVSRPFGHSSFADFRVFHTLLPCLPKQFLTFLS